MKSADFLSPPRPGKSCALLCAALLLLATLGCQQVTGPKAAPAPLSGAELFKAKCSKCHDLERALGKYRSEEVWRSTITRMKEEHQADITQAEIAQLVRYHVDRQANEAVLFKEKCEKCHPGKIFLEKQLSGEQARAIIKRMQQKAGNNISDQDVEIIVRYHIRAQKEELDTSLRAVSSQIFASLDMKRDLELFRKKCTACHEAERALSVLKDPEAWRRTIRRMQSYSKGEITDRDVRELVNFHVTVQQREVETFRQTCTKCHSDARINSRSMSEAQWLATIKRMQRKAPELITDAKVDILAAYFHRRELTLARIFYGKCRLCHPRNNSGETLTLIDTNKQLDGLIAMANDQFGRSLQITDVKSLLGTHFERQKREMQFYESGCTTCHPEGLPSKKPKGVDRETREERSRAEWISFIAALQGTELTKELQETIDSQIDYHMARQPG